LANTAGVVAGQIYTKTQAPEYIIGHAVSLGSTAMANIGFLVLMGHLRMLNNKKDRIKQELEKGGRVPTLVRVTIVRISSIIYRGPRISGANVCWDYVQTQC
jgi:hypothetical protein